MKVDTSAAEAYALALVPGLFGPWARDAINWAELRHGDRVLDVACGPGVATWPAAETVGPSGRVAGVDSDVGMVEIARGRGPRSAANVEFRCASAQELPFDSASFDVVLCLQGLQFFPDRLVALGEMARVLKPGGRLLATVWRTLVYCKGYEAMVEALERRGIDAAAARKPFSLGAGGLLKQAAEEAGFSNVRTRVEKRLAAFQSVEVFLDAIARGAPSSRFALAKVSADDRGRFVAEVSDSLEKYVADGQLRFPMESHVLEAQC